MGKYDDAMYQFLSNNERFADLFNGVLFGGRQVLHAEVLEGDSERYVLERTGNEEFCEALFHDYQMTLVCVEDLKDLSVFRTDLRLLLETLAARKDRNKMKELFKGREFSNLSVETARTIAIMTDNTRVLEKVEHNENNEKGEVNMCQRGMRLWRNAKLRGWSRV